MCCVVFVCRVLCVSVWCLLIVANIVACWLRVVCCLLYDASWMSCYWLSFVTLLLLRVDCCLLRGVCCRLLI